MFKWLTLSTALVATASAANADVTVMSWGGAYSASQVEVFNKPFTEATGIKVNMVDSDNPAAPIRAMVEANNVTIDVADVNYADGVRYCDEGLLEPIDPAMLPAGSDGTPAVDDFLPGTLLECGVGNAVYSNIYAYDTTKFPNGGPTSIADLYDLEKFPGKRALLKSAKVTLEQALMADGVPADQVYELLGTDDGVERAFKKLDTIKDHVVWWEAGAQPPQLLADGEVVMATAFNGRMFAASVEEGKPFQIVWDGQVYEYDLFVIPKGAPNMEEAMQYVAYVTGTEPLAGLTKWISYGPARKSSGELVGLYKDGKTEMGPHMPTSAANLTNALPSSYEFWVDHESELNERFNAWLAAN